MPTGYKIGLGLGLAVVVVLIILWATLGDGQAGDDVAMAPQPEPMDDAGSLGHLPDPPAKLKTDPSITDLDPDASLPRADDTKPTPADQENAVQEGDDTEDTTTALDQVGYETTGKARTVFRVRVIVFSLVGAQMSWVLRPFIGKPDMPFTWFRARESNFFIDVLDAIAQLFGAR